MPDSFKITVEGIDQIVGKFKTVLDVPNSERFRQALLDSSMIVERAAKENMETMIYSLPEGWYKRKKGAGLFGKTMATGKIGHENGSVFTVVASLVHYARIVHFGLGKGRNAFPRPFLTKALQDSKEVIQRILSKAIL